MFFSRKKSAIEKDLRSIRRSAVRTMFLVVLLVSGVAPAFCMWWDYRGEVPWQQQLISFWSVGLRTYPLTLSIAIIAMSRQLGWFKYGRIFFMGAVITAGAAIGDLGANLAGQQDHAVQGASVVNTPNNVFGPLVNSFNYFVSYFHLGSLLPQNSFARLFDYYTLYGFRYFLASVLVGSFAGRTAAKLIRHIPKKTEFEEEPHREAELYPRKAA